MTIGRLSTLLGLITLGVGVGAFAISLLVLPQQTPGTLLLDAVLALVAATLGVILGTVLLGHRLLRPFRELAASIAGPHRLPLNSYLHSNIEELVAVATAIDRTESRLTGSMAQIQRDRADMSALFEHMADGVLVLDAGDRVEVANPAACRLLRQVSIKGRPLASAVHDPDVMHVVRAARQGSLVRHLVELRSPNDHRSWIQVVATQLPIEQRVLILLQDVTELRHAETVRRDFVANVSHELKTPVASLKALVETLEAGALHDPECGPDFLRRMHVEVDGLAQLVAELLELARIEAGRLDLDLRVSCADQLVLDAIERIRPYAARVGLDVHMGIIEPDLLVHADPRQIGQVLSNLLSNAVKFTPPGGWIELGARRDGSVVEIWVRDSGVGIAGHDLIRVFERFYKTDPSRTGTGTGLGLAICKHVVQAHGGWIYAESDGPGRGATFRFTLPAATSNEVEAGCVSNTNQWSTQPARPEAPQRPQSADDAAFRAVFEGYRAELELHCYRILGCGYNRNPMPSSRVSLTERRDRKPSMRRKKRCPWLSLRPRSTDSDHRSERSRAQCSVSRANTADDFMYRAVSPDHPY